MRSSANKAAVRAAALLVAGLSLSVISNTALAQWVYLGPEPNTCVVFTTADPVFGYPHHISIYAPDIGNATGASFHIESEILGPEDVALMTPADGVTIEGDLFEGMTVTWTPRELEYTSLLTVVFEDNAPSSWMLVYYLLMVKDVTLHLAGGGSMPLEDAGTEYIHCHGGGGADLRPPDSASVVIDGTTIVEFKGIGQSDQWGPGATDLAATDEQGWVTGLSPTGLWGYCGECPFWWEPFELAVQVPATVEEGATSKVTFLSSGHALRVETILRATKGVPVERQTWGRMKAIYREEEE